MSIIIRILILLLISFDFAFGQNIEQKLREVDILLNKQEYIQASKILYDLEQKEPNNPAILFSSAVCYIYLGRADLSKNYANKYLLFGKSNADIYNIKGAACEYLDELDSAIYSFTQAINQDKKAYDGYFNRGKIYFNQKNFSLALKDFIEAKANIKNKITNINAEIFIMLAQSYAAIGQYSEAIKEYKIIEKIKKNNVFVLQNIGNLYYLLKKFNQAEKYYSEVLKLEPDNLDVLNNRILCYNELGESEKVEIDRAAIEAIQLKTGVHLADVKFKSIVSPREDFSFSIPEDWRAFVSETSPSNNFSTSAENSDISKIIDTTTILFFNPKFNNSITEDGIDYFFGGELKLFRNAQFLEQETQDTTTIDNISKRSIIATNFELARQKETSSFAQYKLISRKIFSPTEKLNQGFVKAECQLNNTSNLRTQVEYYAVNNSGDLLVVNIWVPTKQFFFYEKLLEYIVSTVKFE